MAGIQAHGKTKIAKCIDCINYKDEYVQKKYGFLFRNIKHIRMVR